MKRRDFLSLSCKACLGGLGLGVGLSACKTTQTVTGQIRNNGLSIPLSAFQGKSGKTKNYVVASHPSLKFPICVYRLRNDEYSALWMMCPHQGAELQVFGEVLQCPAHGSEFSNTGAVLSAPANQPLRRFPVQQNGDHLNIVLS